jgi:hypothetical protein
MGSLVLLVLWAIVSYKMARTMKENEGMDVKPINYAILSVLFGFIFAMAVLVEKYARMKNKVKLRYGAIGVAVLMAIVNLLAIL